MRILKFGGSSVADAGQLKNVSAIVKTYISRSPDLVMVVSAQSGVTDDLVKLCSIIPIDFSACEPILTHIAQRHVATLKELLPALQQPAALAEVLSLCKELNDIAKGASLVGEVTARTRDLILSFGERLSAFCVSAVFKLEIPNIHFADARNLIRTDETFGYAKVNFTETNKRVQEYFAANKGLQVVTGFIASSESGQTTTLGRSGSDYTAAILGAALTAEAIEIWTDVDGVMTADPRFVQEAQHIEQLSYSEAMELSHFGAKVIFPATMQPAMVKSIPIWVKNTFNPTFKGTLICDTTGADNGFVKGITSLKTLRLDTPMKKCRLQPKTELK